MRFQLLASLLALLAAQEAQAFILEFNVPSSDTIYTSAEVDGFLITSEHFHLRADGLMASNGTTRLDYEAGRGRPFTISKVGGGTFALLDFIGAEGVAEDPEVRPGADAIGVVGYRADGTTVSAIFRLDGIHDGAAAGSANDFQPFTLQEGFSNLTSVMFYGLRDDGRDGGIAVDNLNIDTGEPVPDSVAPTVSITSPAAGVVIGTVALAATATDASGVVGVQYRIDGVNLGMEVLSPPYSIPWDTTSVAEGAHTITATARDRYNNFQTSSPRAVTVSNGTASSDPYYLNFDGVDDYVEVADSDSLSFGNGAADSPLTIEFWFRPNAISSVLNLIGKWRDSYSTQEYRLYLVAPGTIRLDLMDGVRQVRVSARTNYYDLTALTNGWHHLAVTYDGRGGATAADGITIYVDGVAVPLFRVNNASYVAMSNTSAIVQIGRESGLTNLYNGGLDEIRLWNVARTPAEIQASMSSELVGTEAGLRAYWKLNDGAALITDSSPSGNVGTLRNDPVWAAGGPMTPPVVDGTPPQISSVAAGDISDTGATIAFTTDEPTTGSVSYTTNGICPCGEVSGPGGRTTHSIRLSGLSPDTLYAFAARAVDAAGNSTIAPTLTFRTSAPLPDTTAPAVSITSPATGTVAGTITLAATATDASGVTGVQFKVDGVNLGAEDLSSPYSIAWDTTTVANGPHTLTVEARDALGNVGTSSRVVTVGNGTASSDPYYLNFDGVDDYVEVADSDSLSFGNGAADSPLTIEFWFRPNAISSVLNLIGKWRGSYSTQEYRLYLVAPGTIRLDLMDGVRQVRVSARTNYYDLTALTNGWHHLAVTYDGRGGATAADGITIYVDGVAVPLFRVNNASYVAMSNTSAIVQIGRESGLTNLYNGGLDEIRLWNVARTPAEIQASMSSELVGTEAGLRAYWKLNDGAALITDSSPSGNVGTLRNDPVWAAGGPMTPPVVDGTPPQISSVAAGDISDTGATIAFTTDEPTTGSVSYTTNGICPCGEVSGPGGRTTHSIRLSGLSPDTLYAFAARAVDAAGNSTIAPTLTFRTSAPLPDTTAPAVSITSPATGTVAGTITLAATATDASGVTGVQFKVDGVNLGAEDLSSPYSIAWDTTTVANGPHTLTVEARDALGNVGTSSRVVTVGNGTASSDPYYLNFDGVDDYVEVADSDSLSFGNGAADSPLTIEFWFRPNAISSVLNLIGKWRGSYSTQEYRLYLVAPGTIRLDLMDGVRQVRVSARTNYYDLTALTNGWHHLAVTYDGRGGATAADGITIYVDGVAVPLFRVNNASYVAMSNTSAIVQIGRESGLTNLYNGGLDEIRLWNVARTPAEIQASMSSELVGTEAGLRAYWKLNEGGGGVIEDSSPSANAGILRNGPSWSYGGGFAP